MFLLLFVFFKFSDLTPLTSHHYHPHKVKWFWNAKRKITRAMKTDSHCAIPDSGHIEEWYRISTNSSQENSPYCSFCSQRKRERREFWYFWKEQMPLQQFRRSGLNTPGELIFQISPRYTKTFLWSGMAQHKVVFRLPITAMEWLRQSLTEGWRNKK